VDGGAPTGKGNCCYRHGGRTQETVTQMAEMREPIQGEQRIAPSDLLIATGM
jgi:hypothetical protein